MTINSNVVAMATDDVHDEMSVILLDETKKGSYVVIVDFTKVQELSTGEQYVLAYRQVIEPLLPSFVKGLIKSKTSYHQTRDGEKWEYVCLQKELLERPIDKRSLDFALSAAVADYLESRKHGRYVRIERIGEEASCTK